MESLAHQTFEPPAPRRVVTAPVQHLYRDRQSSSSSETVETLYSHPDVRIVAFSAGEEGRQSTSDDATVTLPSSSHLERTIAIGPLRIYRAPGSVAFLNCGSALKPIMPKGQCWSITDTNSKFVLLIRRPNYWRIELPVSTSEDLDKARALRIVFDNVLQFEKTPCPFERPFTVSIPKQPSEPMKRRSWAPAPQLSSIDFSKVIEVPALPARILDKQPRSMRKPKPKQRADREAVQPLSQGSDFVGKVSEDCEDDTKNISSPGPMSSLAQGLQDCEAVKLVEEDRGCSASLVGKFCDDQVHSELDLNATSIQSAISPGICTGLEDSDSPTLPVQSTEITGVVTPCAGMSTAHKDVPADSIEGSGTIDGGLKAKLRRRHTGFGSLRSAPSAPQLTLIASPPSKRTSNLVATAGQDAYEDVGGTSSTCSSESFHSTQSWLSPITPLPPSPRMVQSEDDKDMFPYPHNHIALPADYCASTGGLQTPGSTCSDSGMFSACGSLDRTPTRSQPRRHVGLNGAQQGSHNSDELTQTTSASQFLESVTSDRAFTTASERTVVRRRALSPLPPAANMFYTRNEVVSTTRNLRASLIALPMLLVAKTCGLLLRPPSYLVKLMLVVASRIVAGEWRGTAVGRGPMGEDIPVHWDYSDSEMDEDWDEAANEPGYVGSDHEGQLRVASRHEGDAIEEDARLDQSWEID
ncbi:hypothetical protein CC79DRAFT_514510 [Sarocladium strictum]